MAEFEIPEHPEYNRSIRKFETTDPAHADLFNAVVQTLINNDEFFKRVVEKQKEDALDKTGDAKDTTVTFDSEDEEHPSGWTDIAPVTGGEKQSSLWQKVSLFTKNVRYLWKLCGTNDISGLADGTLTGAVSKLNTDLQGVCIKTVSGSTGPDGAGSIGYPEGFTISNTHIISAKIRFTDNEYYVFPYINSDIINEKAYIYFQYKKDSVSFNFGNNLANNTLEVIFARFGS